MDFYGKELLVEEVRQILDGMVLDRSHLLPALWKLVEHTRWMSPDLVEALSAVMNIPSADIYGVASFYSLIPVEPVGSLTVHVCTDLLCSLKNGDELRKQVEDEWSEHGVTVSESPCLGRCDQAPAALVGFDVLRSCDRESISKAIREGLKS